MKRALIDPRGSEMRVLQVVEVGAEFPISLPLYWTDCTDTVTPETHEWDGAAIVEKPVPPS